MFVFRDNDRDRSGIDSDDAGHLENNRYRTHHQTTSKNSTTTVKERGMGIMAESVLETFTSPIC